MGLLLAAHTLAVIVWVGGMFFAHMLLRPSVASLGVAIRLPLWARVFSAFFPWVWLCVLTILASGFALVAMTSGFAHAPHFVNAMMGIGIVMAWIFGYIYFGPWPRFRNAVASEDWNAAEGAIARIRGMVRVNLGLGLLTAIIGAGGRYFM